MISSLYRRPSSAYTAKASTINFILCPTNQNLIRYTRILLCLLLPLKNQIVKVRGLEES